jgi:putative endonuclease
MRRMGYYQSMYYVYILRSEVVPSQTYIGSTKDLKARLIVHNSGGSAHTRKFKPWHIEWYCALLNDQDARSFEKYLKTGSGKAFSKKHSFDSTRTLY